MDHFSKIRELFTEIQDCNGMSLYQDVLLPWTEQVTTDTLIHLSKYSNWDRDGMSYNVDVSDLWDWYAWSRINDLLIRDLRNNKLTRSEYILFSDKFGMSSPRREKFHPFFHEIVELTETTDDCAMIEHEFWPCLMYGDLMFSRAGVRLRCSKDIAIKEIAEKSTLYFTYSRDNRPTEDLSIGWGSNSQWRTKFRRDYLQGKAFLFNVDGKHFLDESFDPGNRKYDDDDMTLNERRELLINRSFIKTAKPHADLWPYDFRWTLVG